MLNIKTRLSISILIITLSACASSPISTPTPTFIATEQPSASFTQLPTVEAGQYAPLSTQGNPIPQNEAEVPRVTVQDAKAAFDSGNAIILDVRNAEAFAQSHIKGAINIPLGTINENPNGLNLDKTQWIITYCI